MQQIFPRTDTPSVLKISCKNICDGKQHWSDGPGNLPGNDPAVRGLLFVFGHLIPNILQQFLFLLLTPTNLGFDWIYCFMFHYSPGLEEYSRAVELLTYVLVWVVNFNYRACSSWWAGQEQTEKFGFNGQFYVFFLFLSLQRIKLSLQI